MLIENFCEYYSDNYTNDPNKLRGESKNILECINYCEEKFLWDFNWI